MKYWFCSPIDRREHLPKRVAHGVEQEGAARWRTAAAALAVLWYLRKVVGVCESDVCGLTIRFRQSVGFGLVLGQAKSPSLAEDDSQSKACAMCLSRICMVGLPDP